MTGEGMPFEMKKIFSCNFRVCPFTKMEYDVNAQKVKLRWSWETTRWFRSKKGAFVHVMYVYGFHSHHRHHHHHSLWTRLTLEQIKFKKFFEKLTWTRDSGKLILSATSSLMKISAKKLQSLKRKRIRNECTLVICLSECKTKEENKFWKFLRIVLQRKWICGGFTKRMIGSY